MDDKINDREQDQRMTTDQGDTHLLVGVLKAPSPMENFNPTTSTSGRGELAMNSPSGLVMVDDSEPNGFSKPLPTWKRGEKGNYVFVGNSEEANLGRDRNFKDKDATEEVSAVFTSFGRDVGGIPDVSPSREACLLEVKGDVHSGLLARVRRSPGPRAMRASRPS
eukprot:6183934-Pleurochrysis_carterae.AAC.2